MSIFVLKFTNIMKKTCNSCRHYQESKCIIKKYNNNGNCSSHDKTETLEELIKERNNLLVSRLDIKRLEFVSKKIDFICWGIC